MQFEVLFQVAKFTLNMFKLSYWLESKLATSRFWLSLTEYIINKASGKVRNDPMVPFRSSSGIYICPGYPYYEKFRFCGGCNTPYYNWFHARNVEERKWYANLFRTQLEKLNESE